jgi:ribosome-binding protein aMBF1 (putative translation factor)
MTTKPLRDTLARLRDRAAEGGPEPEDKRAYGLIAAEVVEQRAARGLSQQELAALCGTTQSAIARLESGRRAPRVDTLLRVAAALDCELVVELRPRTRTKGEA